ncbi:MAG TPA: hypothetical protein PLZ86_09610, partial [bacterium]|nr:hypothetical protein [bacterium]
MPNFSEGRDREIIDSISAAISQVSGDIESMIPRSRPSLKFGTHSTIFNS